MRENYYCVNFSADDVLSLEKLLSSSVELISRQPSPFANLKNLKIYPIHNKVYEKANVSAVLENFFLDSSPSATLTMISREVHTPYRMRLERTHLWKNCRDYYTSRKANSDKNTGHVDQGEVEDQRAQQETIMESKYGERLAEIKSYWGDLKKWYEEGDKRTRLWAYTTYVINGPKPNKTITRHNRIETKPRPAGNDPEVARRTKGFQRTLSQHSGSPLDKPKSARHDYKRTLTCEGGHWKSRSKKRKSSREEDDLSQLWKKCIKYPIELHNIKQHDGESTKDLVRRYKLESRDVKGATECMQISRFMHGITNLKLIKQFHDKIPKTMDEMMRVTTSFLRGKWQPRIMNGRSRSHHGSSKKKQIEEMLKAGKLSHLIKELKQNNGKEQPMIAKKGYTSEKDKELAILMVQSWERVSRQKNNTKFFS
nr:F-box domain, leucine-rich repeat domain, L domain-like protein [Tanacetum cinerariifolium]